MLKRTFPLLALTCLILTSCGDGSPGEHYSSSGSGARTPSFANPNGNVKIGKPYTINGVRYVPKHQPGYNTTGYASWYGPGFHGKPTANGERYDQHALTAAHPTLPLPSMVEVTNLRNGRQVVVRVNDRGPFAHGRIIDLSKAAAKQLDMITSGVAKVRVRYLPKETYAYLSQFDNHDAAVLGLQPPRPVLAMHNQPPRTALTAQTSSPAHAAASVPVQVVSAQALPPLTARAASASSASETSSPPSAAATLRDAWFVQLGSFTTQGNAQSFRRNVRWNDAQVYSASVNGTTRYRVGIGPFASRAHADDAQRRAHRQGFTDAHVVRTSSHDAFVIKR